MATYKKRPHRPGHLNRPPKPTTWQKLVETVRTFSTLPVGRKLAILGAGAGGVVLLVLLMLFLIPRPLSLIENETGSYYDAKNQITYQLAPFQYEPEAWKTKPYAVCGDTDFYPISGLDPKRFLCTVEAGEGVVWFAEDISLPSVENIKPEEAIVCTATETVVGIRTISRKAHAQKIIDAFTEGDALEIIPYPNRKLTLKFRSDAFPGLFYNLTYLECEEGNFLYDRESDRCVDVGTLLCWYITRDDMPADRNSLIGEEETKTAVTTASVSADSAGAGEGT